MRRVRKRAAVVAAVGLLASLGVVSPAQAAHVECGQVITADTTLDGDIGPCTDNGIVIGADGVTLDLNGHTISGTDQPGDGAGVLLRNIRGATVFGGTVEDFDGGVVIEGGGGNSVGLITARDNIGSSSQNVVAGVLYGDGIAVLASTDNRIVQNTVVGNGPFSGIGLYENPDTDHPGYTRGPTTGNVVQRNVVADNVACKPGPFCDISGIRIEPDVGPNNVIRGNTVTGNGLDGISLFGRVNETRVIGNHVSGNGFLGAVRGDGIRVFGYRNLIQGNESFDNATSGISVGRRGIAAPGSLPAPNGRDNRLFDNVAAGNGFLDLHDSNPNCDNNIWRGNTGVLAAPPCTTTP